MITFSKIAMLLTSEEIEANRSKPFIGDGKLTEYNSSSDSWILDQLKSKTIRRGINIVKDNGSTSFNN